MHILPDLAASQEMIRAAVERSLGFLEHHVYLLALLGLMIFYGLETHGQAVAGRRWPARRRRRD
ncbi:MAG: hypothetical protein ACM359_00350 [Bacillota bacterium]